MQNVSDFIGILREFIANVFDLIGILRESLANPWISQGISLGRILVPFAGFVRDILEISLDLARDTLRNPIHFYRPCKGYSRDSSVN